MEFEVTKNKNLISFLGEGKTKPYVFDINTGVLYSMQSKPLKNIPNTLRGYIVGHNHNDNAVIFLMNRMIANTYQFGDSWTFNLSCFTNNKDLFALADKLNSIGYTPLRCDYGEFYPRALTLINDHFKEFAKYYAEENNPTISDFISEQIPSLWAKEHHIEINEVFNTDFVKRLMDTDFTAEQLKYLIGVACRGGIFFYMSDNGYVDSWHFINDMQKYFHLCEVLGITYEKDFFRGLANANRMYKIHKEDIDNRAIQKQYEKHSFNYESDDFTIIVPQTTTDFINEANQQHNCVYSIYLKEVVNGNTNVVFIRRKDKPEKSFITCEINNRGQIRQYLYRFNESVNKNTAEYQFKINLQNWLNENWE